MSKSEPEWKKLKLSFERPYKDDSDNRIPTLYDLTPEGQRIYEPKETLSAKLEGNLRRIFLERGTDFFERKYESTEESHTNVSKLPRKELPPEHAEHSDSIPKAMTTEELYTMRSEILPQLFVALGEMSHARDLLNSVLSDSSNGQAQDGSSLLSATQVTKPASILSVQSFHAQLTIGNKDEALRKAAGLFKSAAESMDRSRIKGERYWVDALRIRRANWGLTPAPLPLGAAIGKGADKTSKDFIISYGLEGSPSNFRRRAIGHLATFGDSSRDIVFPSHQNTQLRIAISSSTTSPQIYIVDSSSFDEGGQSLDNALKVVQTETIDQEIFSLLVLEAGNLPTASARVSERLVVIDAAQGVDLTFELVDTTTIKNADDSNEIHDDTVCELIYHVLRVLLLRRHALINIERARETAKMIEPPSSILQPIIDILQYRVFCEKVDLELQRAVRALNAVGIPSTLVFTAAGEPGQLLVSLLSEPGKKTIGGEAVIRIDTWNTLWFTFVSPSMLTAHLSQATLTISSLPQLTQLLMDEIERCILKRICELGQQLCEVIGGIWFIDLDHCVARWEGCVLNFRISYDGDLSISCSAFRLDAISPKKGTTQTYISGDISLMCWIKEIIKEAAGLP